MKMKKVLSLLLAVLFFAGLLFSCNGNAKGELKKGTIEKKDVETDSAWQPLTTTARAELDAVYQQKLAGTQAFAAIPAVTGTTYYISSINGNDSNDGTSKDTPWASPKKANNVKRGDLVLFECGSEFHRTSRDNFIAMKSGVTYATYGTGAKPVFYGSINASNASDWVKVSGKENVYYCKTLIDKKNDVGTIIFNEGEAWGIKIQMTYAGRIDEGSAPAYKALALKDVSNGLQTGLTVSNYDLNPKQGKYVQGPDLSFYHDTDGKVYLYCEGGNPGTRFSSIELSLPGYAFAGDRGITDATVLNLDFRYFADHCVHTFDCVNFTVKNCSFFFIGGTEMQDYGGWRNYKTRLGDAVENWDSCNGMLVENCYFDQVYDTPLTTQSNNSEKITKNVAYRNNIVWNTWYGVEIWNSVSGAEISNVDVSGNYFGKLGEGFTTTRPDQTAGDKSNLKIDGFIEVFIGSVNDKGKTFKTDYTMSNFTATDNIVDGTTATMIFCVQVKTNDNPQGVYFDRNTYVGTTDVEFSRFYDFNLAATGYPYTAKGIASVQALGIEPNGKFYYTRSANSSAVDRVIDTMPDYVYKAKNGVNLPFRIFFPEGYTEGASYPLVTFLNQESASGNDNLKNVNTSKKVISELISENKAIILVPQCPSGTWTGLAVNNGNYSTTSVSETDVMKAVAAMIRDVADEFKTGKKYAVGVDAGAYAVSDLLARHKDLLAAGVIISGAGDPNASIGNAKVMIVHSENDEIIPHENASALVSAWSAKYVFYDTDDYFRLQHDCWDYAAENEDLLDWLLTK